MGSVSYKTKFAILGALLVPCFGRFALHGTGYEHELYRYLVPLFVGGLAGCIIGFMKDKSFVINKDLRTTNEVLKQEIDERKRAEKVLIASESNLQSVFEAVPVGICFLKDRVCQRANQNWCDSFAYPEASVIGKTPEFLYESKEEYERVGKELYGHLLEDGIRSVYTRLKRSDGEFRDVVLIAKSLDSQNAEAGMVTVAHDITDRNRAEKEKRKLEDQLQQFQKMESIGTLAGGIAHDFNNILGIILGNAELAMDDVPE